MINPTKELFKWGPIDGRIIYMDAFAQAFVEHAKAYPKGWPDSIGYYKDDVGMWIIDYAELRDNGEALFRQFVMDDRKVKAEYYAWTKSAKEVLKFEKAVNEKRFKKYSDTELKREFKDWEKTHIDFWVKGFLPELGNWGAEQWLKKELSSISEITHEQFVEIFEAISAPEELSFFQNEELELLNIKLIKNKEEQERALIQHQKRYYWLRNSYGFTNMLDIDFFRKEMTQIKDEDVKKRIKEIESYKKNVVEKKEAVIKKYNVPAQVASIAKKLSYCVHWQDYRKSFIFRANHIISCFLEEIGRRKNIPFKEICYYTTPEIVQLLEKDRRIDAKARFEGFLQYFHEKERNITYLTGKEANDLIRPFVETKLDKDVKEFSGMVVSKGDSRYQDEKGNAKLTKGKVKIVLTPRKMEHMDQGDILVAPMTSPDFIVAMKKASAIITDEGGMTSHAAIVSRELGIPCIVQTRIATKVLKDGDIVEIDAEKGVVRKL